MAMFPRGRRSSRSPPHHALRTPIPRKPLQKPQKPFTHHTPSLVLAGGADSFWVAEWFVSQNPPPPFLTLNPPQCENPNQRKSRSFPCPCIHIPLFFSHPLYFIFLPPLFITFFKPNHLTYEGYIYMVDISFRVSSGVHPTIGNFHITMPITHNIENSNKGKKRKKKMKEGPTTPNAHLAHRKP